MLRITHTRGRMAPAIEHFASSRVRIGTSRSSEILFTQQDGPGLMPEHAEIRQEGEAHVLLDLGTSAGTYVNGTRVQRHAVRSGDLIHVGGASGPEFRVEILEMRDGPSDASDGRVDLTTAERLVAEAVAQATKSDHRAERIIAEKVERARRKAKRNNLLLTLGLVASFAGILAAAASLLRADRARKQLASELGADRTAPPTTVKGSIPTQVFSGREIYDQNREAVYVIGFTLGNKISGVCTAFAIKPQILATNAHCVMALKRKGGNPIVTQNDSGGRVRLRIVGSHVHPAYKPSQTAADSPDVGLVRVEGALPKTVVIASEAELRAMGPGDDVFVLGFPGRVMDPVSPTLTFLQGHVGRLMAMGEKTPDSPAEATLIQHDAVTRGGNSGSPIFNQYGHVVGVHAAHLDEEDVVSVDGQKTTVVNASPFRIGMRIDLLNGVPTP